MEQGPGGPPPPPPPPPRIPPVPPIPPPPPGGRVPPTPPPPPPPPPRRRFRRDSTPERADRFKPVTAILIGLVSLTGAFLTWKASNLSNQAADTDRRAILETVTVERNRVGVETRLRSEEEAFARYRAQLAAAEELRSAADDANSSDRPDRATDLSDQAQVFTELANNIANLSFDSSYVNGEGVDATFDEARRRRDLIREDVEAARLDPEQTAADADRLHARSLRLVRWIVLFVGVVVLLTVAQLARSVLRPYLAGLSAVLYVVFTFLALTGDKA